MTDAPLLEVRNLTRRYKLPRQSLLRGPPVLTALENASFLLHAGETLGVVGESGSGKSTLARLIMAFERPDAGAVLFRGRDLHGLGGQELRSLRRDFQMVFQDPFGSLNPRRRVGWSISEPLRANGETEDIPRRIAEALEQVGLHAADAGKYPHEFSGGQRQRIAIARAIVTRPALLVADEAVSALDVSVQAQILNLLMDLQDDLGLGMVFISHDLAVVGSICDRVLVLQHGKTLESGAAADVLRSPEHPYTKTLLTAAGVRP
ncbi:MULTISPECIES: ATP-binding cassette domain-containing protein [Sulfitobacter]|uniref:ATP-binding cassette domain-containing protein n=1 Tax=Sulfitobacter TaxID=60136 RepID=UPI002306FF99|nr:MULTISPECIES: ATP-binding cassette domain-containing protein [Sulfitobacter]MDF3381708.1 ABC transporter ATP-binding protein [Sulfitobacter sp. Ks11]MDF3385127.1 ABC transporter ATP-binding protein [Sulfitobacter sp. M85]MDF3388546.1 ABC transporter ATP-binding protein [Sulfitobacter sp. Ks16]MDF3399183.1 ABC transporter ATP-binding protein [Sulfitobacter sp. KE39]MDF3402604.1 ABC transporter ATP-binding protein [Sulfitobacter sp. Ks35]